MAPERAVGAAWDQLHQVRPARPDRLLPVTLSVLATELYTVRARTPRTRARLSARRTWLEQHQDQVTSTRP
ncbi:hypothetical protein [Kitasatospora sp. NPDC059599]|uniref:hypothetical protein n=1 Tax=Kitasatospora sp. NPDC059599 TaxID=3346880 RepID=UPI00367DB176